MYYEREWKPEASKHEIRKAKKEYEKILKDYPLTYEELTPIALEYAKRIEPIMEGNWFSEFVTIFCKEDNEPELKNSKIDLTKDKYHFLSLLSYCC